MGNPTLALLQHPPPAPPRINSSLVVDLRLRGSIHRVRALLKTLGAHGWRCIRASEAPGVTLSLTTEVTMEKSDLQKLQRYAATTRSHLIFGGVPFIQFDWKSGKYVVGKNKADFTGKKLVADVGNVMVGFRNWEDQKPIYFLTRLLDSTIDPIERDELGQMDESQWVGEKDPFVAVTVLPVFDEETRQTFVITAAYGERSETGNVINAFVDHNAARPDAEAELPIIQLCVRPYTKNDGSAGFALQLDVVDWTTRPPAVLKVMPPPLNITVTESAKSNAKSKSSADEKVAKPKRKIEIARKSEQVPF
jgi:hypothetical protein